MSKHLCSWPGCTYDIDPRLGLCYHHWLQLPKPIRTAVIDAWNPEWASQPVAHRQAIKAALDWVKLKIVPDEEPATVKRISRSGPPPTVKRIGRSR